jgi:hypothetical protein
MFFWQKKTKAQADARAYRSVVDQTAAMVSDGAARKLAAGHGFDIVNVTWEDTGRFKGSAVGPNISDMTIQVQQRDPKTGAHELTCMPVIRYPNFADRSADLALDDFHLRVGNERGRGLARVSLRTYLGNLRRYLSRPGSWAGAGASLLAERDTHVLVSAQACFLPVPQARDAEFNPVLFNDQSSQGSPAVLAIVATRQGTSATVIDNVRDGFRAGPTWGQRLFVNVDGQRASLNARRKSDAVAAVREEQGEAAAEAFAAQQDLNMVLLIQVPLKQRERPRPPFAFGGAAPAFACAAPAQSATRRCRGEASRGVSDVEEAVISAGEVEGPFTEIDGLAIERDPRFPIRVTVQFYKATSNGVVSSDDMDAIAEQIFKVYADARYVGSLVTEGETDRPTESDASVDRHEPPGWWDAFWARHYANTGQSREAATLMLWKLKGRGWFPRSRRDLETALEQARAAG